MAYIDGVSIKYLDAINQKDQYLLSSRIGVKIVESLPEPSQKNSLSQLLAVLIIVLVLGSLAYFFIRYNRKKKESEEKARLELKETVEEKYLRLLKDTVHFNTDNVKDSFNDLSHLLSGYFSEKYHFPAAGMSLENLLQVLAEKNISDESLGRIKDFYTKANLVKFAGEVIEDSDFHRFYDTVELVLENQKNTKTEEDQ
jgi:cbb3-type cytochrome oxidase subunit 3